MIGAIAGDVIGSIYEGRGRQIKREDFPLFSPGCHFTDDSLLTIAVADAILNGGGYGPTIRAYALRYPDAGFGHKFREWMHSADSKPYYSYGNGSAMRVSPVAWAFDTEEDVLREAERSAEVTHNHPEGIKGAQATALAVFLARQKTDKEEIRLEIDARFGYDLYHTVAEIRPGYSFEFILPGLGAPGHHRLPRFIQRGRCHPQGHLAGRRLRYSGGHRRFDRRSVLRRRAERNCNPRAGSIGRAPHRSGGSLRPTVPPSRTIEQA